MAPELIGCLFLHGDVGGRIVEVEAYDEGEPASHAFHGETPRNRSMFGRAGRAYVYRSYGIHWCMNVVCEDDRASAVLLRALEPTVGLEQMAERRGRRERELLCSGPGRLCQALGITGDADGVRLDRGGFEIRAPAARPSIASGPRIGVSTAVDLPWRFCERRSRYLSRRAG